MSPATFARLHGRTVAELYSMIESLRSRRFARLEREQRAYREICRRAGCAWPCMPVDAIVEQRDA
jgi:hypothetical protein